ncbi:tripartite tricarboxylate transporter TctB family protein [uncultured Tateyamaria sp.]|uniref:tripartite tricarboxylate transporter TctB family protein n=1 Tax=uncultured Tateyamaria sp. TaxID=455651 RepID=UPI00260660A3|nr:tripartite tricarboxylate transporter TctB family protein [uncultured Tateyamaria sp.]
MQRLANERVIVQLGLLIVAVALYASTFQQSFSASDLAQSPMFFPRIILTLWIGLAVIALVQTIRADETQPVIASWPRIAIVIVAALIYCNIIASEGFFLPSVVFALVCLPAFGIRNPLLVVPFAILVPGALVLLFNHTLGMPLPTSRFTYLF